MALVVVGAADLDNLLHDEQVHCRVKIFPNPASNNVITKETKRINSENKLLRRRANSKVYNYYTQNMYITQYSTEDSSDWQSCMSRQALIGQSLANKLLRPKLLYHVMCKGSF